MLRELVKFVSPVSLEKKFAEGVACDGGYDRPRSADIAWNEGWVELISVSSERGTPN